MVSIDSFRMDLGQSTIINNLSFEVHKGETFGFLGSNGSGKTTTLRALLGIYKPTAGSLYINGKPYHPSMGNLLGYLPEERGLYKKETVLDTMVFFGQLKQMRSSKARKWSLEYLERVDLLDKVNTRIDRLSGGQQQKVQLGVTIINDPQLLILDEPTKGLDPINRRLLMEIIEERSKANATVILVTHQMEEVERLCERIVLLKDGDRRLYGAIDDIRNQYSSNVIEVEFHGTVLVDDSLFQISSLTKNSAKLIPQKEILPSDILKYLSNQNDLNIYRFEVMKASLEDIFVNIYKDDQEKAVSI